MKFYFCVFFPVAVCGLSVVIIREYIYATHKKGVTWHQAQWLCRYYYRDLATVSTAEEHQRIVNITNNYETSWIGLYRADKNTNTWMWSDGEQAAFLKWKSSWLTSYFQTQHCAALDAGYWVNFDCDSVVKSYYCYRLLILVNENKTWEEALQYCATNYTGLASLTYETQLFQAKKELALSQTVHVWTGLRFMDGKWFWLNGKAPETLASLPSCPARLYRCGALNITTSIWENQDCNKKLNFLCYWK